MNPCSPLIILARKTVTAGLYPRRIFRHVPSTRGHSKTVETARSAPNCEKNYGNLPPEPGQRVARAQPPASHAETIKGGSATASAGKALPKSAAAAAAMSIAGATGYMFLEAVGKQPAILFSDRTSQQAAGGVSNQPVLPERVSDPIFDYTLALLGDINSYSPTTPDFHVYFAQTPYLFPIPDPQPPSIDISERTTGTSTVQNIPEPSSLTLLVFIVVFLLGWRCIRRLWGFSM